MVKILTSGDILDRKGWELLQKRVNELQSSSNGPFDVLLISGKCFLGDDDDEDLSSILMPLKCYIFDGYQSQKFDVLKLPQNVIMCENMIESHGLCFGMTTIAQNLTVSVLIQPQQTNTLPPLPPFDINSPIFDPVRSVVQTSAYRGCDILITSDWPKDTHHFLEELEFNELKNSPIGIGSGSKLTALYALLVRPRYHFVSGKNEFYQRSPYKNAPVSPCTRLISIDKVSERKEKNKKWLHAISINPIIHMKVEDVTVIPNGTTENPYIDVEMMNNISNKQKQSQSTLQFSSEQVTKKFKADTSNNNSGAFFFGAKGLSRDGSSNTNANTNLIPPNENATCLFVGGLLRETTESDLKKILPNIISINRIVGKSFAFVEFDSHNAAKHIIEMSSTRGISLPNSSYGLNIGWAKAKDSNNQSLVVDHGMIERNLIPPSSDAKILFVGGLPSLYNNISISSDDHNNSLLDSMDDNKSMKLKSTLLSLFEGSTKVVKVTNKSYAFVEFDSYDNAMSIMHKTLNNDGIGIPYAIDGKPLLIGWALPNSSNGMNDKRILTPPSRDSKVLFIGGLSDNITNDDIMNIFTINNNNEVIIPKNIVSIQRPVGKDFAFIEFINHVEALNVMNFISENYNFEMLLHEKKILFGWAKGKAAESIEDHNCWFCLASPEVKFHLIVSIGEHAYLTLPRGGINDQHALIVPIECVPSRVQLSSVAKVELSRFEEVLDKLYNLTECVSLRYERALRTKGSRDHMQIVNIPIPISNIESSTSSFASKVLSIFMKKSSALLLKFHEIQDDRSIDEIVVSMEGGPYQEYFYIELPSGGIVSSHNNKYEINNTHRRFVYVHEENAPKFPMQFGNELAVEILGLPSSRGHWKNCLLGETEELELVNKFKESFQPFDFT
eukprot:gene7785-10575_t